MLTQKKFVIFTFLFVLKVCYAQDERTYRAAVVEYLPVDDLPPQETLLKNARNYAALLDQVQELLDIVVYPEATLHGNIDTPSRNETVEFGVELNKFDTSLCDKGTTQTYLNVIACAAAEKNTYLVANLIEKEKCESCADGWNLYNTNVALDRRGALISKYRKYNLFGEYFMNQTEVPDISIFKTDFGVEFGMFICFDILFRKPTLDLVRQYNVTHFVYPTMWFSELPFLTALQAQQQWAQEVDGVLLAAGANKPSRGSGGTGIFLGKSGSAVSDIIAKGGSQIYVSSVPKQTSPRVQDDAEVDEIARELDDFYLKQDNLLPYTSTILPQEKTVKKGLCHDDSRGNKICCNFEIAADWDRRVLQDGKDHYVYRLVAYNGVRSFSGVYFGGVEICGLVACVNDKIESCSYRFRNYGNVSWPATFRKIVIKANFTVDEDRIQHPNSLLSSLRPLSPLATKWSHKYFNPKSVERTHELIQPQNRLMTFAIYGRDFKRDGLPSSGSFLGINLAVMIVPFITLKFY